MKLTKQRLKEIIKEEIITEGLKRFKVYVSGQSEPLVLLGKNEKEVKQTAYAMIRNSSIRVKKVVREGINEGPKYDQIKAKMVDTMGLLVKKMGLKSVKKHLVGKGGMSFFLDDSKEAQKLQKYLKSKIKDVRIINLDKKGGDETNFVVYAKVFDF